MVSKTRIKLKCPHCGEYFNSEMRLRDHLMDAINDRDTAIMAMGKAIMELDEIAFAPPSIETKQMILKVKNILLKNPTE